MLKAGTPPPPTRWAQKHPADNVLLPRPLFSWYFQSSFSTSDGAHPRLLSSFVWCLITRARSQTLLSVQVSRIILQHHSHIPDASWAGHPGWSSACHIRGRYLHSTYAAPAKRTLKPSEQVLVIYLSQEALPLRKKGYLGKQRLRKCSKKSEQLFDSSMKSGQQMWV